MYIFCVVSTIYIGWILSYFPQAFNDYDEPLLSRLLDEEDDEEESSDEHTPPDFDLLSDEIELMANQKLKSE